MAELIGIVAGKQAGKTTIAAYLHEKYGYTTTSIAEPLKLALKDIFGFTDEQLYDSKKEVADEFWQITPRYALQFIGTELFRDGLSKYAPHIGADIWAMSAERRIQQYLQNKDKVVVDDIRFPNEAEVIRKLGGILIRVTRPDVESAADSHLRSRRAFGEHISEQLHAQIHADYEIVNDKSLQHLFSEIDGIIARMRESH
ncbi:MAG: hypothetical protein M0R33_22350 [Methylomonas sp.]|jgi:hypothetical protein|uniref:deoxynucleotide monophosphate kinase family protein n=1 Tax=Methylomonas sp. TaxID=418 RepID=UPI0025DFC72C|nr:hypothetical protein [Methylomonas sp.]MCK9609186.1 hypothetical protein [Methylomonas sp.]